MASIGAGSRCFERTSGVGEMSSLKDGRNVRSCSKQRWRPSGRTGGSDFRWVKMSVDGVVQGARLRADHVVRPVERGVT